MEDYKISRYKINNGIFKYYLWPQKSKKQNFI